MTLQDFPHGWILSVEVLLPDVPWAGSSTVSVHRAWERSQCLLGNLACHLPPKWRAVVQFFTELRISAPCSLESCWTWLNTLSSPLHRELVIRTLNQDYFFIILILFILLYLYLFTSLNLLCFIHEWNLFVCCLDKKCLLLFQATCEWNVNLYILYIMSLT